MTPEDRALLLAPPLVTADIPGIGGLLRARPEDFDVAELPAYPPSEDPAGTHLFVHVRKRGLTTPAAVELISRHVGMPSRDVGVAGLKDKHAVTTQWISIPAELGGRLDDFRHEAIEILDRRLHGNKLRRGHLAANRFRIVIRELVVPFDEARRRVEAKLTALHAAGGLDNAYGEQRFGFDGGNVERGLAALADAARRRPRGDLEVSAGQSALFNLLLAVRRERGLVRTVLAGDVLQKTATGGLFTSAAPEVDQPRLDAGEVVVTGPMFGGKTMSPPEGTDARALEEEVLARGGLDASTLAALGKRVPGTRRALQVMPGDVEVYEAPAEGELPAGLGVAFTLPSGSFATVFLRELAEAAGPKSANP
jgi:tRNA pseudouridine13 synthase